MRKATIQIRKDDETVIEEAARGFVRAWKTGKSDADVFTFGSPAQLFAVLTPKRWAMIERLQAVGPISLRGLARALGRDVKRVHEDAAVLIEWGFIERTAQRKIHVPFDVIHADFDLRAAA
ncbi:MAG: transcriptional regulator [Alphaproteobacteria bacterium]|nr:transcriptional regulator [Alphaproteobacteria bacterium]MBM3950178.1 transcriptional regulator [Rhodospirillales bacterium]